MKKTIKLMVAVCILSLLLALPYSSGSVRAADAVPITYRPLGNTYTNKPTYSWSWVSTAASYKLQVYDIAAASTVLNVSISSSSCSSVTKRCSHTPYKTLTYGKSYKWRVSAGTSAFSAWKTFKPLAGFNSQFNGSSKGWVSRPGGTWLVNTAVYYTSGVLNKASSASYGISKTFNNFTYTAKVKRISTGDLASGLIVRGTPAFNSLNYWKNGYRFLYTQAGKFAVIVTVNGVDSYLKDWTYSPAIIPSDWNILKVIADNRQFRFYINGTLVWSGADSTFASGQVGFIMFRQTQEVFKVDWATLGMSELFK